MPEPPSVKKFYVIGDYYVGKSNLIQALLKPFMKMKCISYNLNDMITIYKVKEAAMEYEIYDIKCNHLHFNYYCSEIARSADLVLMVYDIGYIETIQICKKYIDVMAEVFNTYKPIIFVGNKIDQVNINRNQIESTLKQILASNNLNYDITHHITVSSINGKNIKTLRELMLKKSKLRN